MVDPWIKIRVCEMCGQDSTQTEFPKGRHTKCLECYNRFWAEYLRRHTPDPIDPELMPFGEIAKRLGMTKQGVHRCYHSAMKKLRRKLQFQREEILEILNHSGMDDFIKRPLVNSYLLGDRYRISNMRIMPGKIKKGRPFFHGEGLDK